MVDSKIEAGVGGREFYAGEDLECFFAVAENNLQEEKVVDR